MARESTDTYAVEGSQIAHSKDMYIVTSVATSMTSEAPYALPHILKADSYSAHSFMRFFFIIIR